MHHVNTVEYSVFSVVGVTAEHVSNLCRRSVTRVRIFTLWLEYFANAIVPMHFEWDNWKLRYAAYQDCAKKTRPNELMALKSPIWRWPSAFCEVGVQEKIGHNLVSCSLMWLTGYMGQPLFALGLTCVCFVSIDFLSLKGVPVPTAIFVINFQNINWRAQPKSTKKSIQL